jgi:hypothetical protein
VIADAPVMSADLSRPEVRRKVTERLLGSERRAALEHLDDKGLRRIVLEEQRLAGESISVDLRD